MPKTRKQLLDGMKRGIAEAYKDETGKLPTKKRLKQILSPVEIGEMNQDIDDIMWERKMKQKKR